MKTGECAVNATEAAKRLSMARSSLYRMAKAGLIPCFYVGPQRCGIRFIISEVIEALSERPQIDKQS